MFDSPVVDVAIGITFLFLVLSLCATAIVDAIIEWRQWKGRLLYSKLRSLLGNDLVNAVYAERRVADLASGKPRSDHRLSDAVGESQWEKICAAARSKRSTFRSWMNFELPLGVFCSVTLPQAILMAAAVDARRLPSHIPQEVFADVLLDWFQGVGLPDFLKMNATKSPAIPSNLAELWVALNRRADGNQEVLRAEVMNWYKQAMDRTSGEFKRRVRIALFVIGALVVVASNADAIRIAKQLYDEPQMRNQLVATAEGVAQACSTDVGNCPQLRNDLRSMVTSSRSNVENGSPFGWRSGELAKLRESGWTTILLALAGGFATTLAISLGADFWFGALKRIVAIRNSRRDAVQDAAAVAAAVASAQPDSSSPMTRIPRVALDIQAPEVAALRGFQPFRFAESDIHAFWLAQLSNLAYSPLRELERSKILDHHKLSVLPIDVEGTQGFVFQGSEQCIVAFRGTEKTIEDFMTDAKAAHVPEPFGWKGSAATVHEGFHTALNHVWQELSNIVRAQSKPVWFTGHSLGGALAVLAAYRLHRETLGRGLTIGGVYTFGQPRVGNEGLAKECPPELANRIFRYVNASDVVPQVPPTLLLKYSHFGQLRYFDSSGRLHHERTFWERVEDRLTPAIESFITTQEWSVAALTHARERVADHAMARYVECLERVDSVRAMWPRAAS